LTEDQVIDFTFSTFRFSSGAPFTLAGTPAVSVYKANGTTQSTAGVTLTADFDGVTGLNHVRIDTSADAFYATGADYSVVITTGTVDSVSVVGSTVARFAIQNRFAGSGLDAAGVRAAVGLASANLDTQLSTIDTVVDSVLVDTNELQTDWANGGRLDVILDARASQSSVDTIDGIVDAILVDTAEIGAAGAGLTVLATAANLAAVDTVVDAIKLKTDNLPSDPADQSAVEAAITAATSPLATAASLATVDSIVDDILVDTSTTIPATLAGLATQASVDVIDGIVDAILVDTGTDIPNLVTTVDTVVDAIKVKTDQLTFTVANQVDSNALSGGGGLDAAGIRAAVGLAAANLDTQIADLPTNAELTAAIAAGDDAVLAQVALVKAKTDNLPTDPADQSAVESAITSATSPLATAANLATVAGYLDTEIAAILEDTSTTIPAQIAALTIPSATDNADALLDRAAGVETGLTPRQAMRLIAAASAGKLSGAATTTVVIRNAIADSKDRITATVDADGNRTAITADLT
jgi:hypothetical protein